MYCTDDGSSDNNIRKPSTQTYNGQHDGDAFGIPALRHFAEQRSQIVFSGQSRGFTGIASLSNNDIETDGGSSEYLNGQSASILHDHQPGVLDQGEADFYTQAKQQHERKRKLLYTQKIEQEPNRQFKPPKYRTYSQMDIRIKSFIGFMSICNWATWMFAKSGFFFKGFADIVACFHCGLTHKNWQKDDDPIKMHMQLNPDCYYITELRNEGILSCENLKDETADDIEMKEVTNATSELAISSDTKLLCKVCLLKKVEVTVRPCGHFAMCESCCQQIRNYNKPCPICRCPIEAVIKTKLV